MFSFFKKRPDINGFVEVVSGCTPELCKTLEGIDNGPINSEEVGIFIASIIALKILSFEKFKPENVADEFYLKWLTLSTGDQDHSSPDNRALISKLRIRFPVYCKAFLLCIDKKNNESTAVHHSLGLTRVLFETASGRKAPEHYFDLGLVAASGVVLSASVNIFSAITE